VWVKSKKHEFALFSFALGFSLFFFALLYSLLRRARERESAKIALVPTSAKYTKQLTEREG
jgi:hypothetical protein